MSYGGVTYGKTAIMLLTLETIIGEQTLKNALHMYFMKYRFTHPTQEDFLRTVNEVAGQDLELVLATRLSMARRCSTTRFCAPTQIQPIGTRKTRNEKPGETMYETQVILQRKGDFVFPVEAEIKFDNGESTRERWDGKDRWVRYVYRKKAKMRVGGTRSRPQDHAGPQLS